MSLFSFVRSTALPNPFARGSASVLAVLVGSLFLALPPGWAQQSDRLRLGPAGADLKAHSDADAAIDDVNGDGNPDVIMAGGDTSTLYLGNGDGTFDPAGADLDGCGDECALSVADVDGDGALDLLINGTLYLGDGTGGFDETDVGLPDVHNAANAIGDVNGDGRPDLFVGGENADDRPTAALYLGAGDGTFEAVGTDLSAIGYGEAAIADVDADGHPDLLVAGDDGGEGAVTLYLGDGTGSFSATDTGLDGCREAGNCALSVGDLNGDDHPDVLLNDTVYVGAEEGRFEARPIERSSTSYFDGLPGVAFANLLADVNGDGHRDPLFYASAQVPGQGVQRRFDLYLGDGSGAFTAAKGVPDGMGPPFAVGDVDGDGSPDILSGNTLYLGGGQAGFVPSEEPYYVDRTLTREDLRGLGLRTLSLLRNTTYARGGHDFSTDWLAEHFRTRVWYEPSSFDAENVSERDLQNAKRIKAFEEDLTLDQLLLRRALHWEPHGAPPDEWTPPGPFESEAKVREALMLDEAIAERREAGAEPSTPSIPKGFGDGITIGTPLSALPDAIDRPDDGAQWFEARIDPDPSGTDDTLPHGKTVGGYVGADGRIEQLYTRRLHPDPLDLPLSMNNTGLLRLLRSFGAPTAYGSVEGDTDLEFVPMRWEGEIRVAELHRAYAPGGPHAGLHRHLLLRTQNPNRLCGPEDGFDEWFPKFKAALASENPREAIITYIHTPFSGVVLDDYAGASLDEDNEDPPVPLAEGASPSCEPTRGGYMIPTVETGVHYLVQRIEGEWKATELR